MLHPRNEAWELYWHGVAPSGSLLEWIDEMYEPPKTMFDRTLGKWRNLRLAKHLLPAEVQEHMVFKVFGSDVGKPRKHGEFNDPETCFWNAWFWVDTDFDWAKWSTIQWSAPKHPGSLAECQAWTRMKKGVEENKTSERSGN